VQRLQLLAAGIWISKSKMELTADHLLSNAIELARAAAFDEARASGLPYEGELVGEHLGVEVDGERFLTHLFGTGLSGYRDWRWAVTLTRADEDATSEATVCDVVLLPGSDALLAPKWIPYHERIQAGDLTPGAIVPFRCFACTEMDSVSRKNSSWRFNSWCDCANISRRCAFNSWLCRTSW